MESTRGHARARAEERERERENERDGMLSNDAAGACIRDVNSAVVGSPDRPGATPPRTLSDYFTADLPLASARARARSTAPFYVRRVYERTRPRECAVLRAYSLKPSKGARGHEGSPSSGIKVARFPQKVTFSLE